MNLSMSYRRAIGLLIVCCVLVVPVRSDGQDVPAAGAATPALKASTEADLYRDSVPYFRGLLGDVYKAAGKKDARWDAAATQFLEQMAGYFATRSVREFYWPAETPTLAALTKAGTELLALGCDDPVVKFCVAELLDKSGRGTEALVHYRAFVDAAPRAGTPGVPDAWYVRAVPRLTALGGIPDGRASSRQFAVRQASLCAGPLSGVARRQVLRHFRPHIHTPAWRAQVINAIDALPNGDRWIRDILAGRMHVDLAWAARGGGFAGTVTEEGWKGFFANLGLSRDALTRAWKLAPELPESAEQMITVAMGGSDRLNESEEVWFARALEAQVDVQGAYNNMLSAMQPRWGGSHEQMMLIGEACIKAARYETLVPWQYIEAVRQVSDDMGEPWTLLRSVDIQKKVDEVLGAYAKTLGPGKGDYYKTAQVAVLIRVDNLNQGRKLMDEWKTAGGKVDVAALKYMKMGEDEVPISYLYALSGPHRGEFEAMLRHMSGGKDRLALPTAQAIQAKIKPEDPSRLYIDTVLAKLTVAARFEAGEWVRLPTSLGEWDIREGDWTSDGQGGMIGVGPGFNEVKSLLYKETAVSLDPAAGFEMSVVLETTPHLTGPVSRGGILFYSAAGNRPRGWVELVVGQATGQFQFASDTRRFDAKSKSGCELTVRCDNYVLSAFVDGKQVGEPFELPERYREGLKLGLGGGAGGGVRFSNIRVRNLEKVKK